MNIPEQTLASLMRIVERRVALEVKTVVALLRRPNEDGTPCSADREVLAQRIERLEHWK